MDKRVVACAKDSHTVFTRELWAALSQRGHMMNVQGTPAAACQVREGALSVG